MDPAHPSSEAEKMWVVNGSPTTLKVLQFVNGTDPVDEAEQASLASRLGALRTTRCNALAGHEEEDRGEEHRRDAQREHVVDDVDLT